MGGAVGGGLLVLETLEAESQARGDALECGRKGRPRVGSYQ